MSEGSDAHIGMARTLARKLLKRMGKADPPILLRDVILYLRDHENIQGLSAYPVSDISEHMSGIIVIKEGITTIGYNNRLHMNRQRFTVAHEIAHLVIGNVTCGIDNVFENTDSPQETEANQFAAELLMPRESLKKDIRNGRKIPELALKYWVSEEAMGWKVRDLLSVT